MSSQMEPGAHFLSRRAVLTGLVGIAGVAGAGIWYYGRSAAAASVGASMATHAHSSSVGKTLYVYRGHTNGVYAVDWSPDGKRIASGGGDNTVQVWDALTGAHVLIYRGHSSQVNSVNWSPNGKYIASSGDGTVQVWHSATGKLLFSEGSQSNQIYGGVWSPDGTQIATWLGNDNTFQVWDIQTRKVVASYGNASNWSSNCLWSPDGKYFAAYGFDNAQQVPTMQLWDIASHKIVYTTDLPNTQRSLMSWSPGSQRLAFACSSGLANARDVPSGQHLVTYPDTDGGQWLNVAWSPDGMLIAAGSYTPFTVQLWNATTAKPTYTYNKHTAPVQAIAWSPSSKDIASGGNDSTVRVWQAE